MAQRGLKVYIESSILTDWIFLERVEMPGLRVLSKETRDGYALIERILKHDSGMFEFSTSTWAISESMQNYLRSHAMFKMLFDNLSFRYYEAVRGYSRYKLARKRFTQLKTELMGTLNAAEEKKRLSIVSSTGRLERKIHKYLYMGFDAEDAQHLILAIDLLHAEYLVTKDRDFTDQKETLEKEQITVILPSEMLQHLRTQQP